MTCSALDVVVVPFPFAEKHGSKRWPALVVSGRAFNRRGHSVMAMITSASRNRWATDVEIADLDSVGLTKPSKVRFKLFTIDNRVINRKLGKLAGSDVARFDAGLRFVLGRPS